MNWTPITAISEIVAALGVVASLIYVGRQVRQANAASRAAAYQAFVSEFNSLIVNTAIDERISGILEKALFQEAPLNSFSSVDRLSLLTIMISTARQYESVHLQVEEGVLDSSALQLMAGLKFLEVPSWQEAWPIMRNSLSDSFVKYFETSHPNSIASGYSSRVQENHDTLTLTLSSNEALVLFEFLTRYSDEERLEILDQSEQRVLWDIHCMLETVMNTINNPDYEQDVARARAAVRDEE